MIETYAALQSLDSCFSQVAFTFHAQRLHHPEPTVLFFSVSVTFPYGSVPVNRFWKITFSWDSTSSETFTASFFDKGMRQIFRIARQNRTHFSVFGFLSARQLSIVMPFYLSSGRPGIDETLQNTATFTHPRDGGVLKREENAAAVSSSAEVPSTSSTFCVCDGVRNVRIARAADLGGLYQLRQIGFMRPQMVAGTSTTTTFCDRVFAPSYR